MGRLRTFGYAENWAQVKPLIEQGAEGIGLIKIEDQFLENARAILGSSQAFIDSIKDWKYPDAGAGRSLFNTFSLDYALGRELLFYSIIFSQGLDESVRESVGKPIENAILMKLGKSLEDSITMNFKAEPAQPLAVRLLDPEIIFTGYFEKDDPKCAINGVLSDLEHRLGSSAYLKSKEGLSNFVSELQRTYRDSLRGSDFCVTNQMITFVQLISIFGMVAYHRNPGADTAIILPSTRNFEVYNMFREDVYQSARSAFSEIFPDQEKELGGLRLGIGIESALSDRDLGSCVAGDASWFLFGTNDLSAAVLSRDRFTDWGSDEIYKKKLHPKVKDVIVDVHRSLANKAKYSQTPFYIGFAGEHIYVYEDETREFLENLSVGENIIYYRTVKGRGTQPLTMFQYDDGLAGFGGPPKNLHSEQQVQ